ncbi:MAG: MBL fold metallo-hydrolase [Deltaproteobacteria bacterium]|nr:MBL fold metallo-hydrolase [Deltaproteobacteria bacterium]
MPGPATNGLGGQTACVEVRPRDDLLLVLDAGTGLRKLGRELVKEPPFALGQGVCHLLISHTHWDHIQGLPFFAPLYQQGNRVVIYGQQRDVHLSHIFSNQTQDPYFPVGLAEVDAEVSYRELVEGARFDVNEGAARVSCARLNHPYVAVGYRIETPEGLSLAYVSDTAPFDRIVLGYEFVKDGPDPDQAPSSDDASTLKAMRAGVVALCQDADLVIYDTMFEMEEYRRSPHWGHSTPEHALDIVQEAGGRALALFHHHPGRSDEAQAAIVRRVADKAHIEVMAAREGMALRCTGSGVEVVEG